MAMLNNQMVVFFFFKWFFRYLDIVPFFSVFFSLSVSGASSGIKKMISNMGI
jgi:hypothetical protein